MGNIYLDFNNSCSFSNNYFAKTTLQKQFETAKLKYKLNVQTLSELILNYFPKDTSCHYYISMPTFKRESRLKDDEDDYEEQNRKKEVYFNNVVIRSAKGDLLNKKYDLVLFGDISFLLRENRKRNYFKIKGFEFIDKNISKYGEKRISANAVCSFTKTGNTPDFSESWNEELTKEDLNNILTQNTPVPNYDEAMDIYESWNKYLSFRKEYLKNQVHENTWELSDIEFVEAYSIDKAYYKDSWFDMRLDKKDKKQDPVILLENVEGTEKSPLIRVCIDIKGRSRFDELKRKTNPKSYPMKIEFSVPLGEKKSERSNDRFYLGDRCKIEEEVIPPDFKKLEKYYEKEKISRGKEISDQYKLKINKELEEAVEEERARIKKQVSEQEQNVGKENLLDYYIANLDYCDKNVQSEVRTKLANMDIEMANIKNSYELKISKSKNNRKKAEEFKAELEKKKSDLIKRKEAAVESIFSKHEININALKSQDQIEREVQAYKEEKRKKLLIVYEEEIKAAVKDAVAELKQKEEIEKKNMQETGTVYRTIIYFLANGFHSSIEKKDIESEKEKYKNWKLTYNDLREKTKIDRQEKALENFFDGVLKNPFLPLQLLSPSSISVDNNIDLTEPKWFSDKLNKKQKSAIKLALRSDGIFLLQGPPGTGKTQVIAELTAQLAKEGKRVAISSETNKAIENVFERFEKIPEIRAFRLSRTSIDSEYLPKKLLNNFYENVSTTLDRKMKRLEDPEQFIKDLKKKMDELKEAEKNYFSWSKKVNDLQLREKNLKKESENITVGLKSLKGEKGAYQDNLNIYEKTENFIRHCDYIGDYETESMLMSFKSELRDVLLTDDEFGYIDMEDAKYLYLCNDTDIDANLTELKDSVELKELKEKHADAKRRKQELTDEYTDEALPGCEMEWKTQQTIIKNTGTRIRTLSEHIQDVSGMKFVKIFGENKALSPQFARDFRANLMQFKHKIKKTIEKSASDVEKIAEGIRESVLKTQRTICDAERDLENVQNELASLANSEDYSEFSNAETRIKKIISEANRDFFEINIEQDYSEIDIWLNAIKNAYNQKLEEKNQLIVEAQTRPSMYKKISDYLKDEDVREQDKERYTEVLFERTNVYGFTSSSGKDGYTGLSDFGITDISIEKAGIDVVIIDEVSKSAFVDILVPILYGKSVILVGDHRQLPPLYDLRYLKKADFEDMGYPNPEKADKENKAYTKVYEESYFKQLFELVPDGRRETLQKQYRCHTHIMEVFNYFYGGSREGLKEGEENQNEKKQHGLFISRNGKAIIEPGKHVYFVDCKCAESGEEESSSLKNVQEADVAVSLLNDMNEAYGNLIREGKITEKLSAGVICTYGLQARTIKKHLKRNKLKNFSENSSERLVIDTVDNFQGDERDIIIVSMVRSPKGNKKVSDFIKQFERINVAYSRARRLLIILGNKDFLSTKCSIDLPDMKGDHTKDKKDYLVYSDIIKAIEQNGKVLDASDILGGNYDYEQ